MDCSTQVEKKGTELMTLVQVQLQKQTASQHAKGRKRSQTASSLRLCQPVPTESLLAIITGSLFSMTGRAPCGFFRKGEPAVLRGQAEAMALLCVHKSVGKTVTDNNL